MIPPRRRMNLPNGFDALCLEEENTAPLKPRPLDPPDFEQGVYVIMKVQGLQTQIGAINEGFAGHVDLVFAQKINLNNCVEWILEHVSNKEFLFPQ